MKSDKTLGNLSVLKDIKLDNLAIDIDIDGKKKNKVETKIDLTSNVYDVDIKIKWDSKEKKF